MLFKQCLTLNEYKTVNVITEGHVKKKKKKHSSPALACDAMRLQLHLPQSFALIRSSHSSGCVSVSRFGKTAQWIAAMSVQVVAAKMAEVELKDVPKKDLPVVSPVTAKIDEKGSINNEGNVSATSPMAEPGVRGDPSPVSPNPVKMPQASAMKRPDPQQNGGEAFVNSDGTVAEAPRMKKVIKAGWSELRDADPTALKWVCLSCSSFSHLASWHCVAEARALLTAQQHGQFDRALFCFLKILNNDNATRICLSERVHYSPFMFGVSE